MNLTRMIRQRVNATLAERGVSDTVLLEKLCELAMEIRAAPAAEEDSWRHPAVQLVRRLTGNRVPSILIQEVVAKLKDQPETAVIAALTEWTKRGYNPAAYGWLDWVATGAPERNHETKTANRSRARSNAPVLGGHPGKPTAAPGTQYDQLFTAD